MAYNASTKWNTPLLNRAGLDSFFTLISEGQSEL